MRSRRLFAATMPSSRQAYYHLGYMDGCVFMDFDHTEEKKICLKRISFDGYGCCELGDHAVSMDEKDSKAFKDLIQGEIKDQNALMTIIKRTIAVNKTHIWTNALEAYQLI